jgi:hypothetical protein
MFILKTIIDKYCKSKEGRVYTCFVDFQKAFDTVLHAGFKLKLLDIGVGYLFYKITKNMYEVSNAAVRCNNHITNFMPITLGVKQGDKFIQNFY